MQLTLMFCLVLKRTLVFSLYHIGMCLLPNCFFYGGPDTSVSNAIAH